MDYIPRVSKRCQFMLILVFYSYCWNVGRSVFLWLGVLLILWYTGKLICNISLHSVQVDLVWSSPFKWLFLRQAAFACNIYIHIIYTYIYMYIYIVIPEIMWINSTSQSRSSLLPKSIRTAKRIPKYERLSWQGTYTLKQEMASDIPTSGGMKTFQRTALLLQFFSFMAGIKLSVFT
jgi:hypothetical protein